MNKGEKKSIAIGVDVHNKVQIMLEVYMKQLKYIYHLTDN